MSSERRPWYPWYPRDFNQDEKVKCLSDDAELLYRRALDVMWQANDLQLPSNCLKLANALARGWQKDRFESAWNEIQTSGFELFKTTEDGLFIYSDRLKREVSKIETISNTRKELGKIGGQAKAKQKLSNFQANGVANTKQKGSHTHTHTDINKTPISPLPKKQKTTFTPPTVQEVEAFFSEKGYSTDSARRAFEYYSSGDWKDSRGTQVQNWKRKMIAVWFKDENLAKQQPVAFQVLGQNGKPETQEERIMRLCS